MPEPAIRLPPQVWIDWSGVGLPPSQCLVAEITDDAHHRPAGGLWTSTLANGTTAYVQAMAEIFADSGVATFDRPAWLLTPDACNVFEVVDRMAEVDLIALAPGFPVWPQVARQVDAVHMTAGGALAYWRTPRPGDPQRSRRLRTLAAVTDAGLGSPFDMWEAESTVWFRWRFLDEQPIGELTVPQIGGGGGRSW